MRTHIVENALILIFTAAVLLSGCGGAREKVAKGAESSAGSVSQGSEQEASLDEEEPVVASKVFEIPADGDPGNHFFTDDVLVAFSDYRMGNQSTELVVKHEDPALAEEGPYYNITREEPWKEDHAWRTRPATAADLKVGVVAVVYVKRYGSMFGVRPPKSPDETYRTFAWWLARVTSVAPLASEGYVLVAEGYKVVPESIRVADEDDSPTAVLEGEEDAHFIRSDHMFIRYDPKGDDPPPAYVAAATTPVQDGKGTFIRMKDGRIMNNDDATSTRIAGKKDLKKGALVLAPKLKDGEVFRAPKTREEALFSDWFSGKIKKKSKKTVVLEEGQEISRDALRVPAAPQPK